ncbi:hypothetical protein KJS94_11235 [Flavihumibacter rivuli]|uniref:hypothetical protein n=1 Tax=Flavihumibacter rivuli TaxID=2838156 RepID=UPI001BDDFA98|nr:hypothetical protein [Flavihumibacter rivuli]ULQ55215.1 hypothetical protein KJS94_11235 [Flavihumibacter rivuli]
MAFSWNRDKQLSLITYLVLVALTIIGLFYGRSITGQHEFLRVWDWSNILLMLVGIPFILFQPEAGFPELWAPKVSNRQRIIQPVLIGVIFGLLDLLVVKVMMHPEPYTSLPPFLQPFPYSIFLYVSGAFEIEVFYRLIPLTLVMWLASRYKNGRHWETIFWVMACLTALCEPLEQFPSGSVAFILYAFLSGFLMNFLQALYFRKAGFLASLFLRLGHYLVWHILLGIYVEQFELP